MLPDITTSTYPKEKMINKMMNEFTSKYFSTPSCSYGCFYVKTQRQKFTHNGIRKFTIVTTYFLSQMRAIFTSNSTGIITSNPYKIKVAVKSRVGTEKIDKLVNN